MGYRGQKKRAPEAIPPSGQATCQAGTGSPPPPIQHWHPYARIRFSMKSRLFITAFGIALSVALAPSKADAATTFNFNSSSNGLSSFNLTEDGITLTVSNIISNTGLSIVDTDGLCVVGLNSGFCGDQPSLSFAFNTPVRLISYTTGYNGFQNNLSLSFTQNSNTTTQTSFPLGITTFSNQFTAVAGVPIVTSPTSTTASPSSLQFTQLTVEQVTTVPGPVPLAGAAVALSWSRRLRHRVSSR